MKNIVMRHTINTSVDNFWKLFVDAEYNRKIFLEDLRYASWRVLEQKDGADSYVQRVEMQPPMDAPGPIKKLMGDSFKLTEEGTLDKKSGLYRFKAIPSTMADKISVTGTIRVEAAGANSCTRITEIALEAKVFGLGGMIESSGAKSTEDGYAAYATALNKRLSQT